MKHATPQPPALGIHDGLAYALFEPEGEPTAGVVICHGAGSAKEAHFDYGRVLRASGMAAIAYDMRGHGRSEGDLDGRVFADALEMASLLEQRGAGALALRGTSLGGFCAISAAALAPQRFAAVVAICPAPEDFLLRGLRSGSLTSFRADRPALDELLEGHRLVDSAAALSPETALLLLHAEGDEQVPYAVSEELFAAAGKPKKLLVMPGGHHRSIQHDLELQALSVRFVERAVADAN